MARSKTAPSFCYNSTKCEYNYIRYWMETVDCEVNFQKEYIII